MRSAVAAALRFRFSSFSTGSGSLSVPATIGGSARTSCQFWARPRRSRNKRQKIAERRGSIITVCTLLQFRGLWWRCRLAASKQRSEDERFLDCLVRLFCLLHRDRTHKVLFTR